MKSNLNNFNFIYSSPVSPEVMDWSPYFPAYFSNSEGKSDEEREMKEGKKTNPVVEFADIGCGYGGLLGTVL